RYLCIVIKPQVTPHTTRMVLTPASSSTRRNPCSTIGWSSMIRTLVILADLHTKKYSGGHASRSVFCRDCARIRQYHPRCFVREFYIYEMLRARAPAQCPLRRSLRCGPLGRGVAAYERGQQ